MKVTRLFECQFCFIPLFFFFHHYPHYYPATSFRTLGWQHTQALGSKFPLYCLQNSRKVKWFCKCHHRQFNVKQIFWVNSSLNSTTFVIHKWLRSSQGVRSVYAAASVQLKTTQTGVCRSVHPDRALFQLSHSLKRKGTLIFVIIFLIPGSRLVRLEVMMGWGAVQWPGRQFNAGSLLCEATSH